MGIDKDLEYALQWESSSKHFYINQYYDELVSKLSNIKIVLEIGCGVGYSTLSLLKQGHKVIAIDKNEECIKKAQQIVLENGFLVGELSKSDVQFIKVDIISEEFYKNILPTLSFNGVICWNIGSSWGKDDLLYYIPHILNYGLDITEIQQNPESAYAELIIWHVCQIAKMKNVQLQLVERGSEIIDKDNEYYQWVKREFDFKHIEYSNIKASTISAGGRILTSKGRVIKDSLIDIYLSSIIMK